MWPLRGVTAHRLRTATLSCFELRLFSASSLLHWVAAPQVPPFHRRVISVLLGSFCSQSCYRFRHPLSFPVVYMESLVGKEANTFASRKPGIEISKTCHLKWCSAELLRMREKETLTWKCATERKLLQNLYGIFWHYITTAKTETKQKTSWPCTSALGKSHLCKMI